MITADQLLNAYAATERARSLIQGFHYAQGTDSERYVVRDVSRKPESQELWVGYASHGHSDETLERAIRRCEMDVIAHALNHRPEIGDPNVND